MRAGTADAGRAVAPTTVAAASAKARRNGEVRITIRVVHLCVAPRSNRLGCANVLWLEEGWRLGLRRLEADVLRSELHHQAQLAFGEQRFDGAHGSGLAADFQPLADLERLLAADVSRRDDLVATSQFIAVVEARHRLGNDTRPCRDPTERKRASCRS
jgi:hypothetical protein